MNSAFISLEEGLIIVSGAGGVEFKQIFFRVSALTHVA